MSKKDLNCMLKQFPNGVIEAIVKSEMKRQIKEVLKDDGLLDDLNEVIKKEVVKQFKLHLDNHGKTELLTKMPLLLDQGFDYFLEDDIPDEIVKYVEKAINSHFKKLSATL